MENIVLLGAGDHSGSVIDSIESQGTMQIIGIIDKNFDKDYSQEVAGYQVIGSDCDLRKLYLDGIQYAFVSIGDAIQPAVKVKLYQLLKEIGFIIPCVVDPSASVSHTAVIEEGVFVAKQAVVNAHAAIGKMTIINSGSVIEHDCNIGNFVSIAPGAVLCGNVKVGNYTVIGPNCTLHHDKTVGEASVIGAASNVTRNMPSHIVAYGNPCKMIRENR